MMRDVEHPIRIAAVQMQVPPAGLGQRVQLQVARSMRSVRVAGRLRYVVYYEAVLVRSGPTRYW